MASQFSLLNRKSFIGDTSIIWYSEPMYWGGFQRCEAFLHVYSLVAATTGSIVFEGSSDPGYNATWRTIAAGSPADPSALTAAGLNKYVRDGTLYPYVRLKLTLSGSGTLGADVSLDGTLFEVSSNN